MDSPELPSISTEGLDVNLAPQIAIGFCDICASGCRAVQGILPDGNCGRREWNLKFDLVLSTDISSVQHEEVNANPIKVVSFLGEGGVAVLSYLAVLGDVKPEHQVLLANAILDFIQEHSSNPDECEVVVAAALRLPEGIVPRGDADSAPAGDPRECPPAAYHVPFDPSQETLPGFSILPPSTALLDGVAAALLHLCRARDQMGCMVLVPGYRPRTLAQAVGESELKRAAELSYALGGVLRCAVSEAAILDLRVDRLWFNQAPEALPIYI